MSEESFNELDAELGKLKIQFDEKVDACIKAIKNRKAESKMIAGEIKKLRQMKQASDNNTERLINYMMAMMTSLELTEAGTGLFKASIRNSPMTVEELDIHEVPENFVAVELKIKKREIIDHIKKTGEIPPGRRHGVWPSSAHDLTPKPRSRYHRGSHTLTRKEHVKMATNLDKSFDIERKRGIEIHDDFEYNPYASVPN